MSYPTVRPSRLTVFSRDGTLIIIVPLNHEAGAGEQGGPGQGSLPAQPPAAGFRTSADQLKRVSPLMNRVLTTLEAQTMLRSPRGLDYVLPKYDPDLVRLFLTILHNPQHPITPLTDLLQIAKLTQIAAFFECPSLIASHVSAWLSSRDSEPPRTYCPTLMVFVSISLHLHFDNMFAKYTSIAIAESPGQITSMGAPISGDVLEDLNQRRNCFIGAHFDVLHNTLNVLLKGPPGCTVDCDSRMLDALMNQMKQHGLLRPKPAAPYSGLTHRQLASTIASFKCPAGVDMKTVLTLPPSLQNAAFIWSLRVQQADYVPFCSWTCSLQRIAGQLEWV
ncbi:predicted protein [Aspergillus nidulans FGSC A4]|uniref:BTB domain-containing protein n=1 Tax=Emericella nidulans (strain FGSC A4 / ATCC 38163 / CBS 112.46 / NRRL 194 / M139) TaxID=227321 RepID=Q5ART8_EMENI|nr:hypothetical protein [Aspergillus nidulans FGSC A4]EAA64324.1 predicted protein [Aspergillus nidulans FGSC A4]CBF84502.1 TPA: conserved hypothetical protein [Aspergillus nidulans FGSC A4]|eukprot:XP_682261.1 predicted protein [Aspergillus nidulans FGSC A4]